MVLKIVEHKYHLTTTLSGLIYLIESNFLRSGAVIEAEEAGVTTTLVFYQSRGTYDLEVILSAEEIEEYYDIFAPITDAETIEEMINDPHFFMLEETPLTTEFTIPKSSLRNWLNDPKFKETPQAEEYKLEDCISLEDLLVEVHTMLKGLTIEYIIIIRL